MKLSTAYLPHEIFAPADRGDLPRAARLHRAAALRPGSGRARRHRPLPLADEREARRAADVGAREPERGRAAAGRAARCRHRVRRPHLSAASARSRRSRAHVEALASERIDCVIAAGGGKCIDAGKGVAFRLGTPVVIVPTLASNDAPCSALSVIYSPEGVSTGVEFYPAEPGLRRRRHRHHRGGAGALPRRRHGRRHGHLVRGARLPAEPGGGHDRRRAADARVVRHRRGLRADALRGGRALPARRWRRSTVNDVARGGRRGQHAC